MRLEELVVSLVKRHMRGVNRFVRDDGSTEAPAPLKVFAGEQLIGWYLNPAPWSDELVGFTDRALYLVHGEQTLRLRWEDMTAYEGPDSKTEAAAVRVCAVGRWHEVRLRGSHAAEGINKDAFSLGMVLRALTRGV